MKYLEWLANVVVVLKKRSKWRGCVDYTNLNEECLKDSFPLPRINQIVDVPAKHEILSFLDAFSRYHQILMHPPDVEKKAFITSHGLYCYDVKRDMNLPRATSRPVSCCTPFLEVGA